MFIEINITSFLLNYSIPVWL